MRYLAASGIQVVAFAIAACIFGYAQAETPSAQLRIKLAKAEYFPGEAAREHAVFSSIIIWE